MAFIPRKDQTNKPYVQTTSKIAEYHPGVFWDDGRGQPPNEEDIGVEIAEDNAYLSRAEGKKLLK